jgi:hypothetical protein
MRLLFAMIGLLLTTQAFASDVWLSGVDPYVRQTMTSDQSDYMALFTPSAPWKRAATGLVAFKTSTQWIMHASEGDLTAMFVDLHRRGIALAVEALMTPVTTKSCGNNVEGYSAPGYMASMAARIKKLGGGLKYVAMDEPLWYGHHYTGPHSCQSTISDLVESLAVNVKAIRGVFPNVQIGDIEPMPWANSPNWLDELMTFVSDYHTTTGTPLDFIHADVQWTNNSLSSLQRFTDRVHDAGTKVGFIYNGNATDLTDEGWTMRAEQRFITIEKVIIPDQAILQTWMRYPSRMLPETQPGTMTYLVDQYLAHQGRR